MQLIPLLVASWSVLGIIGLLFTLSKNENVEEMSTPYKALLVFIAGPAVWGLFILNIIRCLIEYVRD